jgi:hypothetical protein
MSGLPVWCLLSIGLLLVVIKTPLRQLLYNRSWPFWSLLLSSSAEGSVDGNLPERDLQVLASGSPEAMPPAE